MQANDRLESCRMVCFLQLACLSREIYFSICLALGVIHAFHLALRAKGAVSQCHFVILVLRNDPLGLQGCLIILKLIRSQNMLFTIMLRFLPAQWLKQFILQPVLLLSASPMNRPSPSFSLWTLPIATLPYGLVHSGAWASWWPQQVDCLCMSTTPTTSHSPTDTPRGLPCRACGPHSTVFWT